MTTAIYTAVITCRQVANESKMETCLPCPYNGRAVQWIAQARANEWPKREATPGIFLLLIRSSRVLVAPEVRHQGAIDRRVGQFNLRLWQTPIGAKHGQGSR